jgi:hypothetical protein
MPALRRKAPLYDFHPEASALRMLRLRLPSFRDGWHDIRKDDRPAAQVVFRDIRHFYR